MIGRKVVDVRTELYVVMDRTEGVTVVPYSVGDVRLAL